jgi:hypothetical protein
VRKKIKDKSESSPHKRVGDPLFKKILRPSGRRSPEEVKAQLEELEALEATRRKQEAAALAKSAIARQEKEIEEFEASDLWKEVADYYKKMEKSMQFDVDEFLEYCKRNPAK